jgi:hypothetical protein
MPDLDGTIALVIGEALGVGHCLRASGSGSQHGGFACRTTYVLSGPGGLVAWWRSQVPPDSDAHVRRPNAS